MSCLHSLPCLLCSRAWMRDLAVAVLWHPEMEEDDKRLFEALRGQVPGLVTLEIGINVTPVEYACDVVLYSEFASRQALDDYARHPEHLRVRRELEGLRIARHQVDFETP